MIIQATTRIIIRITVIMLDLMLPGASGEEVLKEIRKQGRLPATELKAAIMIHMMPITDHQMTIQTIVNIR